MALSEKRMKAIGELAAKHGREKALMNCRHANEREALDEQQRCEADELDGRFANEEQQPPRRPKGN